MLYVPALGENPPDRRAAPYLPRPASLFPLRALEALRREQSAPEFHAKMQANEGSYGGREDKDKYLAEEYSAMQTRSRACLGAMRARHQQTHAAGGLR